MFKPTLSSLGKAKKGMEMRIIRQPIMRKPPHHIPIQWRSPLPEMKSL